MLDLNHEILNFIVGFVLIIWGKSLFWLFFTFLSVLYGFNFSEYYLADYSIAVKIVPPILSCLFAIGIAVGLRPLAKAVVGILAGGFIAMYVYPDFLTIPYYFPLVYFTAGAVAGFLLNILFYNFGISLLSSFIGSMFIFYPYYDGSLTYNIGFGSVVIIGIIIQAVLFRSEEKGLD